MPALAVLRAAGQASTSFVATSYFDGKLWVERVPRSMVVPAEPGNEGAFV